jgi:N-acetylmuramoyl-L-alanine amidase
VTARRVAICVALLAAVLAAAALDGQSPPPTPLRLMTSAGSRPLPTLVVNDVEYVALDELALVFPLAVREDAATHAITVTWRGGRTVALTPDQSLASVAGKLVSLPTAPVRIGGKWFVPIDFLPRALALVAVGRLELRKASRLVIAGDVRLPRVAVRHDAPGNEARLTFDVSPPTPHTVVQEQGRLVVRFEADGVDASIAAFTPQGYVQAIRTADTGAAIVVELGPRFASFRAIDVPGDGKTARLVLDVFGSLETQAPPPAPGPAPPPPQEPPLVAAPAAGLRTIVVDPGHGGTDTGAKSTKGALEKDIALAMARRLKATLESRMGARVLLTRDDDRLIGADDRASLANNNKADLFLSLHLASSVVTRNTGASIYVLDPAAFGPDATLGIAEPAMSMPVFGGGTREVDVIPWNRAQARYVDDSSAFAMLAAARLQPVIPLHPRGVQRAPLRVLVGANMPAVLVELGYLSNTDDEARATGPETQARLAQALAEAIVAFDQRARERAAAGGVR